MWSKISQINVFSHHFETYTRQNCAFSKLTRDTITRFGNILHWISEKKINAYRQWWEFWTGDRQDPESEIGLQGELRGVVVVEVDEGISILAYDLVPFDDIVVGLSGRIVASKYWWRVTGWGSWWDFIDLDGLFCFRWNWRRSGSRSGVTVQLFLLCVY